MEDDADVKILVELIFRKKFNNIEEVTTHYSTFPTCMLTNDFPSRMNAVLCIKQANLISEWQDHIDLSSDILSSNGFYMASLMIACLTEHGNHQNVFESFISVCALLVLISDEVLNITGMDVCGLNVDVFMAFYDSTVKDEFFEHGGLPRFIEYINGHRYLTQKNIISSDDPSLVMVHKDIKKEVEKEFSRLARKIADVKLTLRYATSIYLTQEVLSTVSDTLPTVLTNSDVIKYLIASGNEETAKITEIERTVKTPAGFVDFDVVRERSSSNSDSETRHAVDQNKDNTQFENIIQAVIRCNHSRNSNRTNLDNRIQKETNRILGHFKDTIKSFITVLDEYDET